MDEGDEKDESGNGSDSERLKMGWREPEQRLSVGKTNLSSATGSKRSQRLLAWEKLDPLLADRGSG